MDEIEAGLSGEEFGLCAGGGAGAGVAWGAAGYADYTEDFHFR